ncbi:alpha-tubulin suppressor-like RCC1 family protein, partial [Clostridium sardiniense]|nr:alpha-tubulin suppressor-like RCC1 family protein [Clostridium sardiniense]
GDGTGTDRNTPTKINGKGEIGENTKIIASSMSGNNGSAIDSEGNLYTWGKNGKGQLGDGTRTGRNSPVKINGKGEIGENTKIIASSMGDNNGSAIDSEGNLYTWGGMSGDN